MGQHASACAITTDSATTPAYPYQWQEKTILWRNDQYLIATGNSDNTYLTLWTTGNKKIGTLDVRLINKKNPNNGTLERRAKICMVDVNSKHRGQGMGVQLYRTLLAWLPADVAGLYSYLPDRYNTKQVPRIYRRLNGYVVDMDHAYVDRPAI